MANTETTTRRGRNAPKRTDNVDAFNVNKAETEFFALGREYRAAEGEILAGEGRRTEAHSKSLILFARICEAGAVPDAMEAKRWALRWRYGKDTDKSEFVFGDATVGSHLVAVWKACTKQEAFGVSFADMAEQAKAQIEKLRKARKEAPPAEKKNHLEMRSLTAGLYQLALDSNSTKLPSDKQNARTGEAVQWGSAEQVLSSIRKPAPQKKTGTTAAAAAVTIDDISGNIVDGISAIIKSDDMKDDSLKPWLSKLIDLRAEFEKFKAALA